MSIQVVAQYTVSEGQLEAVLDPLRRVVPLNRAEPGCEAFDVHQEEGRPERVVLLERWSSDEHIRAHRASPHFQQLVLGEIVPRLTSRTVTRLTEVPL
jgi:quinol monooxygenase YgiN